ncbi:hypothetical protein FSOLCH5_008058 [Fusarium solani]
MDRLFAWEDYTKNLTYLFENPKDPLSPVATEGLHYAKPLHSLISIDLGNCQAPNILLNDDDLKYAIDTPESPNRKPKKDLDYRTGKYKGSMDRYSKIPRPNTFYNKNLTFLDEPYDEFRPLTGKLGCQNSTIAAQYLCSVPKSKSIGTMFFGDSHRKSGISTGSLEASGIDSTGDVAKCGP